jgi:hypothetical protein
LKVCVVPPAAGVNAIAIDCVAGDTSAGVRAADALLLDCGGTTILIVALVRAVALTTAGADGTGADLDSPTGCLLPARSHGAGRRRVVMNALGLLAAKLIS